MSGIDVTNAVIGELWRVGGPGRGILLEVRLPRSPCSNLAWHMGTPRFHHTFGSSGRVGALLKVRVTGTIAAGASILVEHRPTHSVTVRQVCDGLTPDLAQQLLGCGQNVALDLRRSAARALARSKH